MSEQVKPNDFLQDLEKKVNELKKKYASLNENVIDAQQALIDKESQCYSESRRIISLYKNKSDNIEQQELKYNEMHEEFENVKVNCFKEQATCFGCLQELYNTETSLYVNYIKLLRMELEQLRNPSFDTPLPPPSTLEDTNIRRNNLE